MHQSVPRSLSVGSNVPTALDHRQNKHLTSALEGLASRDFQHQWEAAKQLRDVGEAAIAPLIALVEDDAIDEDIRWFAARTLGDFDHPQAIAALAQLLDVDESDLAEMAATALAQIGSSAIAPLSALLQSDSTRLLAVKALGRIRQRAILTPLLQVMTDDDPEVRQVALEALASFQDPRILPVLIQALGDPAAGVRQEALIALGLRLQSHAGDTSQADSLQFPQSPEDKPAEDKPAIAIADLQVRIRNCLYDIHLEVCMRAAVTLGRWGTAYAVNQLAQVLKQSQTPDPLKIQVIQALGWTVRPGSVEAIAEGLTLAEPSVRCEAIRTLAMVESIPLRQRATDYLLQHLQRQPTVLEKQAIALGLSRLGCDQALRGILTCLADGDESVQLHAIAALKQLDTIDARQHLQQLTAMSSLDDTLRLGIQKALAEW